MFNILGYKEKFEMMEMKYKELFKDYNNILDSIKEEQKITSETEKNLKEILVKLVEEFVHRAKG